ncbi:MAG: hypothetical protein II336_08990 [Loktanella sp.]|nr:hypothetical protein [Loktanella sp.]
MKHLVAITIVGVGLSSAAGLAASWAHSALLTPSAASVHKTQVPATVVKPAEPTIAKDSVDFTGMADVEPDVNFSPFRDLPVVSQPLIEVAQDNKTFQPETITSGTSLRPVARPVTLERPVAQAPVEVMANVRGQSPVYRVDHAQVTVPSVPLQIVEGRQNLSETLTPPYLIGVYR